MPISLKLSVHYTGLIDESSETGEKGKIFDSSLQRMKPFTFTLGANQVIRGWDLGLTDMCAGEKRTLIIPPDLGYGGRGAGQDIPGGATLRFDVEAVDVEPPNRGKDRNIFKEMDVDEDGLLTYDEYAYWMLNVRKAPDSGKEYFQREDINKDGVVSWDEFGGPKGTKDPRGESNPKYPSESEEL